MSKSPFAGIDHLRQAGAKFGGTLDMTPEEVRNTTLLVVVELSTRMGQVEQALGSLKAQVETNATATNNMPRWSDYHLLRQMAIGAAIMSGIAIVISLTVALSVAN